MKIAKQFSKKLPQTSYKNILEGKKENRVPSNRFLPGLVYQAFLRLAGQGLYELGKQIQGWGYQLQVRYATRGPEQVGHTL